MVASSAKIRRPTAALAFGASAFTCSRKAVTSDCEDGETLSPGALAGCPVVSCEAGIFGSFAIMPTKMPSPPCGDGARGSSMAFGDARKRYPVDQYGAPGEYCAVTMPGRF